MALRLSNLSRFPASRLIARGSRPSTIQTASSLLQHVTSNPATAAHRQSTIARFASDNNDSGNSSYSPIDWYRNRQERKEEVKYRDRLATMSQQPVWTVGDMLSELDEVVQSWVAKIPLLSNNKETKMAKQMHKSMSGIVEIMGADATSEMLEGMSRTDKLKAALQGETTEEEIKILVNQFQTMDLMHRVLRKRVNEGRTLPQTADAMQAAVQSDGSKLLSKAQRTKMMDGQARKMKKQQMRRR